MSASPARVLTEAVQALDVEAREHKRLSEEHRRKARSARDQIRRIRESCYALGIDLIITEAKGGHSERRSSRT